MTSALDSVRSEFRRRSGEFIAATTKIGKEIDQSIEARATADLDGFRTALTKTEMYLFGFSLFSYSILTITPIIRLLPWNALSVVMCAAGAEMHFWNNVMLWRVSEDIQEGKESGMLTELQIQGKKNRAVKNMKEHSYSVSTAYYAYSKITDATNFLHAGWVSLSGRATSQVHAKTS